jgi:hypothetical protein
MATGPKTLSKQRRCGKCGRFIKWGEPTQRLTNGVEVHRRCRYKQLAKV